MEHSEQDKKRQDAILGAAALGAAALPIAAVLLNLINEVINATVGRDSIFAILETFSYILSVPTGLFGLFGYIVLALIGAIMFGVCRWIWFDIKR
jgi:hypothetical protein